MMKLLQQVTLGVRFRSLLMVPPLQFIEATMRNPMRFVKHQWTPELCSPQDYVL